MTQSELEALMPVLTAPEAPDFRAPALEVRAKFAQMLAGLPVPEGIAIEDDQVGGVRGVWTGPEVTDSPRVVLYLHGGGYVAGNARGYGALAGLIAQAAEGRAFLPDYGLAPENPYPAALDDAVAAYRGLLDAGHLPSSVSIAGDSAGGGLAAATLLAIKRVGLPSPGTGVLLSPWTDLAGTGSTLQSKAAVDPLISAAGLANAAECYLAGTDAMDPGVSPLYGNFDGVPPLLIEVGTREVLLMDATRLAQHAAAADVDVTLRAWPGMVHVFSLLWFALSEGRAAIEEIGAFLRRHTS